MSTRLMSRTDRLSKIEQLLFRSPLGMRAVEIAEKCDVDRRTIYRDLSLLTDIGIPIHQKDGRFFIDRENYTATVRLSFDETLALFLVARVAEQQENVFNPHLPAALDKLAQALPTHVADHVELLTADGKLKHTGDTRARTVLETISRSWSERRKVKLWCSTGDDSRSGAREFCPYFIEPSNSGRIRVVGFDSLTQRVRAIGLNRILRARLLPDVYQVPAQLDPRRFLGGGWSDNAGDLDERLMQTVILIFSPEVRVTLKDHHWHGALRVETLEDKRIKIVLQVTDWREMLPWLRSWGSSVEVVEPQGLREECAVDAARVINVYAQAR